MHNQGSQNEPYQPELQASPLLRILFDRASAITFFLLVAAALAAISFALSRLFAPERAAGVGIIILLLTLAWVDRMLDMRAKAQPWGRLAAATGLHCRVSGLIGGYPVHVEGDYRSRQLALCTSPTGKGLIQSTHIDLCASTLAGVSLRLRGPFDPGEIAMDKVSQELFSASSAREYGANQRFFARCQPPDLVAKIFADSDLRPLLEGLPILVSIELHDGKLRLEQIGVVRDVVYLLGLFDLLSDLASLLEEDEGLTG